ncbi:MAG: OmpH family outer membrane protein [Alphaproteobacteria bacterium]|nr:OmpH family outer membrane protein [Alphaproteobacteria bacterium]MBV9373053.1 OmpH family outer membrane protein [Alphaproteobacteria bacterium]MBV9902936.1 OmpH family outer membrane protein [Alphaproteobacteria bacterium]
MTRYAFGAAIAALSLTLPGAAMAQRTPAATIVVVDTARIYSECNACRAASTQLQGMITSAQQRAQALGQPLQTEAQSIETAANQLQNQPAGPARNTAQTALQNRVNALQTRQNTANQELQRLEQNIQSTRANVARQISERMNPIINQVMTTHGANLAVDQDATLAHANGLDVTTEVLTALNAALPSVSVTPLPASAAPAQPQPQGR